MKKNKFLYIFISSGFIVPAVSFASGEGLEGLLLAIKDLTGLALPFLVSSSILFFFWGTAQFILNGAGDKTREDGKQKMIWGVVALFIMASIFGILQSISSTIGVPIELSPDTTIPRP